MVRQSPLLERRGEELEKESMSKGGCVLRPATYNNWIFVLVVCTIFNVGLWLDAQEPGLGKLSLLHRCGWTVDNTMAETHWTCI